MHRSVNANMKSSDWEIPGYFYSLEKGHVRTQRNLPLESSHPCYLRGLSNVQVDSLKKVSMVTLLFGSSEEANDGSPYFYQNHPIRHLAEIMRGQHIH